MIINKRKLPIGGVQTFSKLRKEYDIYLNPYSKMSNFLCYKEINKK
jgi:hypothetical protein